MSRRVVRAIVWSASLVCWACAGSTPAPVTPAAAALDPETVDASGHAAPRWVGAPSSYRKGVATQKVVCTEGSADGARSLKVAQTTAADRARIALARELENEVSAMLEGYAPAASEADDAEEPASEPESIQDASCEIAQATLEGIELSETWTSRSKTLHTLVCLNVERFKSIVSGMSRLAPPLRAAVVQRADKAWSELLTSDSAAEEEASDLSALSSAAMLEEAPGE